MDSEEVQKIKNQLMEKIGINDNVFGGMVAANRLDKHTKTQIAIGNRICYTNRMESQNTQGGLPSSEGSPSRRKKGGMPMYVTYSDLIQIGIFIVTLIGLCYTIFGRKK